MYFVEIMNSKRQPCLHIVVLWYAHMGVHVILHVCTYCTYMFLNVNRKWLVASNKHNILQKGLQNGCRLTFELRPYFRCNKASQKWVQYLLLSWESNGVHDNHSAIPCTRISSHTRLVHCCHHKGVEICLTTCLKCLAWLCLILVLLFCLQPSEVGG